MPKVSHSPEEIKEMLEQVTGVISVKPVIDDGEISEIHVLSRADRNPKQVVRDIESVCNTTFNVEIDHKKISVAQIEEDELDGYYISRLHPKTIHLVKSGPILEVKVELFSDDGHEYTGTASGPMVSANQVKLVAHATLSAVEDYLHSMCRFILDDAVHFTVGDQEGVLMGITLVTPKSEESLVGSALVQGDIPEAAVKAVLNAVNRRVVVMVAS
ncbi:MAG: hypothetical protein H0Z38_08785 [Firmicutes bacterium]|nr:hypothetical protein [Bacillota bacterium]